MALVTPITPTSFRAAFPAFVDPPYTDVVIQFWIDLAAILVANAARWGTALPYGQMLFMAHNLSLEYPALTGGAAGQAPGQIIGPTTSASVDKVSYSRDPGAAMDPANGHWNLTTYGLRYIRLVRLVGSGPVQVGVPMGGDAACWYPGAWPGPNLGPSW